MQGAGKDIVFFVFFGNRTSSILSDSLLSSRIAFSADFILATDLNRLTGVDLGTGLASIKKVKNPAILRINVTGLIQDFKPYFRRKIR
jgi:hypothetical protein